ncbi:hypothetical protein G6F23_015242 [Rhizopus arrhizus]|nr:hypothetical protein G6F23_015242 [Rhizopus arrhizus]
MAEFSFNTRKALKTSSTSPWYAPTGIGAGGVPLAMALIMRVARPKGRITRRRNCTSARASAATSKAVAASVTSSSREASVRCVSMLCSMVSSRASRNCTMEPINGT